MNCFVMNLCLPLVMERGWVNLNDFAILFLFLALPLCRRENHANKYLFSPYTPETGDKAINKKHYSYWLHGTCDLGYPKWWPIFLQHTQTTGTLSPKKWFFIFFPNSIPLLIVENMCQNWAFSSYLDQISL